ncbi:MAG: hypothetical protein ABR951_06470 [Candidatus Aminicenantales bacterium]|jgi:hypothetical protein
MKVLTTSLAVLFLCAAALPQTQDLGMGAYSNEKGPIMLAVDSSLVSLEMKEPYVMFVVYMAAKDPNQNIAVNRDGVVLVYNGLEYKMPSINVLQKQYRGEIHDLNFYRHLGKEGLIATWVRFYRFPEQGDFFPPVSMRSQVVTDEGSMAGQLGFRTKCYFKNPGFQKGDKLIIRVTAKNNPALSSEVEVTLK